MTQKQQNEIANRLINQPTGRTAMAQELLTAYAGLLTFRPEQVEQLIEACKKDEERLTNPKHIPAFIAEKGRQKCATAIKILNDKILPLVKAAHANEDKLQLSKE